MMLTVAIGAAEGAPPLVFLLAFLMIFIIPPILIVFGAVMLIVTLVQKSRKSKNNRLSQTMPEESNIHEMTDPEDVNRNDVT